MWADPVCGTSPSPARVRDNFGLGLGLRLRLVLLGFELLWLGILILIININFKCTINRKQTVTKVSRAISYCSFLKKSCHFECVKLMSDQMLLFIDTGTSFQAIGPQLPKDYWPLLSNVFDCRMKSLFASLEPS